MRSLAGALWISTLALAAALGLRWLLDPWLGDRFGFGLVFGAIAVAVWAGGWRVALPVALIGLPLSHALFHPPRGGLGLALGDATSAVPLAAGLLIAALFIAAGESLHRARRQADRQRETLRATFSSIGEGVIATDADGRVANMNTVAELLTGWYGDEAMGLPVTAVFRLESESPGEALPCPAQDVLASGRAVGGRPAMLLARDGRRRPVDHGAAPIRDRHDRLLGCVLVFGDRSERRQAERALQERTALLNAISDASADLIFVKDRHGRLVFANPATLEAAGLEATDLPADKPQRHALPAERAAIEAHDREVLETGRVLRVEEPITLAGGAGQRTYLSTKQPLVDAEGRVAGVIGISHDITERRRDERLLEGQRRVLEMVALGAPAADVLPEIVRTIESVEADTACSILVVDAARRVHPVPGGRLAAGFLAPLEGLSIDAPYAGPCGCAADTAAPVEVPDIATDTRWSPAWQQLALGHGLRWCLSLPVKARDGQVLAAFALYRASPEAARPGDADLLAMAAQLAGIAIERHEAERERAAELEAITAIQSLATRLMGPGELQSLLRELLATAARLLGTPKGNIQVLDPVRGTLRIVAHQGLGEAFVRHFAEAGWVAGCGHAAATRARHVVEDVDAMAVAPDDPALLALRAEGVRAFQSTPLLARDGRLLGVMSNHFDHPHQPGARALHYVDLLARMAADLIERAEAERALVEDGRRKDEFLATLAHELRNPLAPIRTAVELLRRSGPPETRPTVQMLERQVAQLVRLVDDLLDIGRVTTGKVELRRAPTDLAAVVAQAVEAAGEPLRTARHALRLVLPERPVMLDADPARLAQVVGNLLSNAIKFTPAGGRIEIAVAADERAATIVVADDGLGLEAGQLDKVFEMFSQVHPSHPASGGGLGIGLPLARRLVELHGGTLEAASDGPGRGCRFVIRLPRFVDLTPMPSPLPSTAPAAAPAAAPGGTERPPATGLAAPPAPADGAAKEQRRVLVVDDNRDAAESLGELLAAIGHEVRVAHDGSHALAVAEAFAPDVVLLDLGLPDLDGYEVCRRLRARPAGRGMRIVALTGWGQDQHRQRSQAAGFDAHLVKPADIDRLITLLA